jgi:hypothetical protein
MKVPKKIWDAQVEQKMKSFLKKIRKYPLVEIYFYDHASANGQQHLPPTCLAYGRLIREDSYAYYLAPWIADSVFDEHSDVYPVVKTKGLKIRRLK